MWVGALLSDSKVIRWPKVGSSFSQAWHLHLYNTRQIPRMKISNLLTVCSDISATLSKEKMQSGQLLCKDGCWDVSAALSWDIYLTAGM